MDDQRKNITLGEIKKYLLENYREATEEEKKEQEKKPFINLMKYDMTHHTDPFEYSEYKRSDHQESTWDKVVTVGAILSIGGLISWLIIRTIFTVI